MGNIVLKYFAGFVGLTDLMLNGVLESAGDVAGTDIGPLTEYTEQEGDYFSGTVTGLTAGMNRFTLSGGLTSALWGLVPSGNGICRLFETRTDALNALVSSTLDPLANPVPGSYEAGTAGEIIGRIPSLLSRTVTTNNEQLVDGDKLELIHGDDYHADEQRQKYWEVTGIPVVWPNGTVCTLFLRVDSVEVEITGSIDTLSGDPRRLSFNVLKANFADLEVSSLGTYTIKVTTPTHEYVSTIVAEGCLEILP